MKNKKIISFLDTYKASINIKDDFNNVAKLNSFIPTTRNLKLLNNYIDIVTKQESKAVLLSGAYGTGKSYIGAVLLGLLGGDLTQKELKTLLEKIKTINPEFAKKVKELLPTNHTNSTKKTNSSINNATLTINNYLLVFPKDVLKSSKGIFANFENVKCQN